MKLESKIMMAACGAVTLATALSIAIVYRVSSQNRVTELRGKMSSIIAQSELVAANMDELHKRQMFDLVRIRQASLKQAGGRPLSEAIAKLTSTRPFPLSPLGNPCKGRPTRTFQVLHSLPPRPDRPAIPRMTMAASSPPPLMLSKRASSNTSWKINSHDELVLARPVRLTASCLNCHGDPATSADS